MVFIVCFAVLNQRLGQIVSLIWKSWIGHLIRWAFSWSLIWIKDVQDVEPPKLECFGTKRFTQEAAYIVLHVWQVLFYLREMIYFMHLLWDLTVLKIPLVLIYKCVHLFAGLLTGNWELCSEKLKKQISLESWHMSVLLWDPRDRWQVSKHCEMEDPFTKASGTISRGEGKALLGAVMSVNKDPGRKEVVATS